MFNFTVKSCDGDMVYNGICLYGSRGFTVPAFHDFRLVIVCVEDSHELWVVDGDDGLSELARYYKEQNEYSCILYHMISLKTPNQKISTL